MENLTLVKSTLKPAWQNPCPSGSGSSKKHTRTASIRRDNSDHTNAGKQHYCSHCENTETRRCVTVLNAPIRA